MTIDFSVDVTAKQETCLVLIEEQCSVDDFSTNHDAIDHTQIGGAHFRQLVLTSSHRIRTVDEEIFIRLQDDNGVRVLEASNSCRR
jgi:hypothetical protein